MVKKNIKIKSLEGPLFVVNEESMTMKTVTNVFIKYLYNFLIKYNFKTFYCNRISKVYQV